METVTFKDFNFKLAVVHQLIKLGEWNKEIKAIDKNYSKYDEYYDTCGNTEYYGPHPDIYKFFQELPITTEQLDKVKKIDFDGGNNIYLMIAHNWDGQDDLYTVKSLEDITLLQNLEVLSSAVLLDIEDASSLLTLSNLKKISTFQGYGIKDKNTVAELKKKGVIITD